MIEFKTTKPSLMLNSLTNKASATFEVDKQTLLALEDLEDAELVVTIKKYVQKRTLTQNAYMWVLLQELAIKLGATKDEVYRHYVRDYGVCKPLPIKNEAVDDFVFKWKKGGLGWFCEVARDSKVSGYSLVMVYFGTSTYTKEEMMRVLDAIIEDCKEQGINTMPYDEITNMEV